MKNKLTVFAVLFFTILCLAYNTSAGTLKKAELKVPGIVCASAGIRAVEAALSVQGVTDALDDITNNTLTVTFDKEKADLNLIQNALKEAGYPADGEPRYLE